jgi:hypothetical protein
MVRYREEDRMPAQPGYDIDIMVNNGGACS